MKESKSKKTRKIWSPQEVAVLRKCMTEHGISKGAKIASEMLKVELEKCVSKMHMLRMKEDIDIPNSRRIPKTRKRETLEALKKNIMNNPNNLQQAFRLTAEETGLTAGTIESGWYNKKSPLYRDNIGVCFMTIGNARVAINRKNCGPKDMLNMMRRSFKKWVVRTLHITRADL